MFGALNDPYLVLLVLFCAAVITIGAIVTALRRVPRAGFAQLKELKELTERPFGFGKVSSKLVRRAS
jgi:hypothetical protein